MERIVKTVDPVHEGVPSAGSPKNGQGARGLHLLKRVSVILGSELRHAELRVVGGGTRPGGPGCLKVRVEHAVHHVHLATRRQGACAAEGDQGIREVVEAGGEEHDIEAAVVTRGVEEVGQGEAGAVGKDARSLL